jgi:hypothetical protein
MTVIHHGILCRCFVNHSVMSRRLASSSWKSTGVRVQKSYVIHPDIRDTFSTPPSRVVVWFSYCCWILGDGPMGQRLLWNWGRPNAPGQEEMVAAGIPVPRGRKLTGTVSQHAEVNTPANSDVLGRVRRVSSKGNVDGHQPGDRLHAPCDRLLWLLIPQTSHRCDRRGHVVSPKDKPIQWWEVLLGWGRHGQWTLRRVCPFAAVWVWMGQARMYRVHGRQPCNGGNRPALCRLWAMHSQARQRWRGAALQASVSLQHWNLRMSRYP